MHWKIYNESVRMAKRRFCYFPYVFYWRGQRHEVEAVEGAWTIARPGWRGRVERHFFRVRCAQGDFELYQEIRAGTWHLRRAQLASARTAAFRRAVPAWR
jgi:hypothetical protein